VGTKVMKCKHKIIKRNYGRKNKKKRAMEHRRQRRINRIKAEK
jgi:hypothetical protein